MRIKVNRYSIKIIPENETDEAYIEEVLKLKKDGDHIKLVRNNVIGLSSIVDLETEILEGK